jgi:hypothetical protein
MPPLLIRQQGVQGRVHCLRYRFRSTDRQNELQKVEHAFLHRCETG